MFLANLAVNRDNIEKIYDDFRERGIQVKEVQEFLQTRPKKQKKAKKVVSLMELR